MDFNRLKTMLILLLFNSYSSIFCQVYNYSPITYGDFETNPSQLASDEMNNQIQISHLNSFNSKNAFSSNNLKYSKYFPSSFLGLGLSLVNTNLNKSIHVNHAGIGIGYRNVLFNKMYLKLGVTYKIVGINTTSGSFDYFSFTPSNLNSGNTIQNNLNTSLSLNTDSDRFFLSFGVLNIDLPWNNSTEHVNFPSYYVMHIGNLLSLTRRKGSEISYTGFIKSTTLKTTVSHYIKFKYQLRPSRRSLIDLGSRIGFADNEFYHFIPFITYSRRKLNVHFSYNFQLNKTNFQSINLSTYQLSLIVNL